jgi:hypothetical protein
MPGAEKSDAEQIDDLASRLNRCSPSRTDPDRFFEERNDIVVQLRRIARRLRGQSPRRPRGS